jgi:hypothetical protein
MMAQLTATAAVAATAASSSCAMLLFERVDEYNLQATWMVAE